HRSGLEGHADDHGDRAGDQHDFRVRAGVPGVRPRVAGRCAETRHTRRASPRDVQARLSKTGTRSFAGTASRWPRKVLVVSEVALAVVLLVSAGLLVPTFTYLLNRDPGFDTTNVVTASVSLQDARYTDPGRVNYL